MFESLANLFNSLTIMFESLHFVPLKKFALRRARLVEDITEKLNTLLDILILEL